MLKTFRTATPTVIKQITGWGFGPPRSRAAAAKVGGVHLGHRLRPLRPARHPATGALHGASHGRRRRLRRCLLSLRRASRIRTDKPTFFGRARTNANCPIRPSPNPGEAGTKHTAGKPESRNPKIRKQLMKKSKQRAKENRPSERLNISAFEYFNLFRISTSDFGFMNRCAFWREIFPGK